MNERIIHPALRELAKTYQQLIDVLDGISPPGAVMIVERPRRATAEASATASISGPVSGWTDEKRARHATAMRAAWRRRRQRGEA